ncbi:hypothetical protein LOK49_LG05G02047 [Camellia lanceoleosa]|uniref:Uncharacterized protein n=1 Tax=Camellia lanceoleosa TaxID=1840588 RepID=A0ACC0HTV3_9ERIC|nr:hypothetical protein LOK49_LG05G02047 [Camellia lanceoleosa]
MLGMSGAGLEKSENSKNGGGSHDVGPKSVGEDSQEVAVQPQSLVDSRRTGGFLMELNGPEHIRPNINLEVVIPRAQGEVCPLRPAGPSSSDLSESVDRLQPIADRAHTSLQIGEGSSRQVWGDITTIGIGQTTARRSGSANRGGKALQQGRILPQSFSRGAILSNRLCTFAHTRRLRESSVIRAS